MVAEREILVVGHHAGAVVQLQRSDSLPVHFLRDAQLHIKREHWLEYQDHSGRSYSSYFR